MTRCSWSFSLAAPLVVLLAVGLLGCAHDPPAASEPAPPPAAENPQFTQPVAEAQKRVNLYFQGVAASAAFKDCWSRVQGEGLARLAFHYKKTETSWTFEKVTSESAALPKGQDAVAEQCLQAALTGTSFPVLPENDREKTTEGFALHWTWPVPMPTTPEAMAARMQDDGGDGADVPGCSECVTRTEYPYGLKCVSKDSGGNLDCREHETNVCSWSPTTCLRGGFGMAGGVVMF